ncbi:hypothetical protein [Lachnoclostridium sp.]|uniref:hypothetical protein n=1 Tax=Lachnoclostridium sp. TaxID=2028282 RepID=UPI00289D1CF5|nr:hypothetical protein [Lachnoclostridium sp.]
MSDYIDLLKNKAMTLIMSLPSNDPELAKVAFEYGADVVKVHINVEHRASKTHFGSIDTEKEKFEEMLANAKGPMGIVLGGETVIANNDFDKAAAMGFKFISLYGHHMPISVLQSKDVYRMMACDYSYRLEEIKVFKEIGVDVLEASIVHPEGYGDDLNSRDILNYRILCKESGLPVVIPTQRKIKPSELSILDEVGVSGIMIGAIVTGKEIESIKRTVCDFKEAILKL